MFTVVDSQKEDLKKQAGDSLMFSLGGGGGGAACFDRQANLFYLNFIMKKATPDGQTKEVKLS